MSELILNPNKPLLVNPTAQPAAPVDDKAAREAKDKRHTEEVDRQKALSAEELEAQRKEFAEISLGRARPKKVEKKEEESKETKVVEETDKAAKEEAKPKEDKKEAEGQQEDKEEEPKPAKKAKAKRDVAESAPSVDTALKDAITHGVEKAVKPLVDQLKTPVIDEAKLDLTPRQQKMLEVTRFMEGKGDKYKGVTVKTLANFRAEKEYREAWEAKNPDEQWSADDEAHNAFYAKHPPTMSEDEFETAKESLIEDRVSKKLSKEHNERVSQFEQERKFETAKPQIERAAQESMLDMIPLAVPAFGPLMGLTFNEKDKVWEGEPKLTAEIVNKMRETDPEAFEIMDVEGEKLRIELRELDTLTQFPGHYQFNSGMAVKTLTSGERIFPHAAIKTFVDELEAELDGYPKDKDPDDGGTFRDGRYFITHAEYASKIKDLDGEPKAAREAAMKDLKRKFWWLETPAIRKALIKDRAAMVEVQLKRFEARAQRLSKATNGENHDKKAERAKAEAEKEEKEQQEEDSRSHKPPNTAIASDKVDTSKKGGPQGTISEETWLSKATGR